ncbi:MAG TPA: hypothetical protein VK891_00265, partial [Euzebyales bacterium]|nr:hypothetical protein [Euzebyales bacterium]
KLVELVGTRLTHRNARAARVTQLLPVPVRSPVIDDDLPQRTSGPQRLADRAATGDDIHVVPLPAG